MSLRSQDVRTRTARFARLAALLLAALGALGAMQAAAQNTRHIASLTLNDPANGDTCVLGETITATLAFAGNGNRASHERMPATIEAATTLSTTTTPTTI